MVKLCEMVEDMDDIFKECREEEEWRHVREVDDELRRVADEAECWGTALSEEDLWRTLHYVENDLLRDEAVKKLGTYEFKERSWLWSKVYVYHEPLSNGQWKIFMEGKGEIDGLNRRGIRWPPELVGENYLIYTYFIDLQ